MNQIDFKPGDSVVLRGWPPREMKVTDTRNPVLLTVRAPNGATLRVGRETVVPVGVRDD
jgi:hypothetical protein